MLCTQLDKNHPLSAFTLSNHGSHSEHTPQFFPGNETTRISFYEVIKGAAVEKIYLKY